jgi:hypothetical protein
LQDQSGFYILPIISASCFLLTIELGGETGEVSDQQKTMKNVMRGLGLMSAPMMSMFPQVIGNIQCIPQVIGNIQCSEICTLRNVKYHTEN